MAVLLLFGLDDYIEIMPGAFTLDTKMNNAKGNDASSLLSGEAQIIDGVLHAFYKHNSAYYLRVGSKEYVLGNDVHSRLNKHDNKLLLNLHINNEHVAVAEPIPDWLSNDPTGDHLSWASIMWTYSVHHMLSDIREYRVFY